MFESINNTDYILVYILILYYNKYCTDSILVYTVVIIYLIDNTKKIYKTFQHKL